MSATFVHCPRCATVLVTRSLDDAGTARQRAVCPREGCGFVHYDNPLPVVAAIVERVAGDGASTVVLVRNRGWPEGMFGLVTGFLERGETPEAGVLREVKEELGLDAELVGLVGAYGFEMRNELIVAYHVRAEGEIRLGEELEAHKEVGTARLKPWPFGTGLAVRDWLAKRAQAPSG
jgi:NAD+ diphosphatase